MSRDFFKRLLQIAGQRHELTGPLCGRDALVIGPDEHVQMGPGQAVLPPGVIGGFNLDRAQRDNGGPGNNSYFLTIDCSGEPFAQVLFRVGDGQRCRKPNINL